MLMEKYILIAADSVTTLRKVDVLRVLENNRPEVRVELAQYIADKRPDLAQEVDEVMAEELGLAEWRNAGVVNGRYETELARLLKLSTLTPGNYIPSEDVKNGNHVAVFVGNRPVILSGPSNDPLSVTQAESLAASPQARFALMAAGHEGEIRIGVAFGKDIDWQANESAVVSKPSGQVEHGNDDGPLVAIVLNDKDRELATKLSVTTETARILDAAAPELDDGHKLAVLARGEGRTETIQETAAQPIVMSTMPGSIIRYSEDLKGAQIVNDDGSTYDFGGVNPTKEFARDFKLSEAETKALLEFEALGEKDVRPVGGYLGKAMYIARFDSRSFNFIALGETSDQAQEAMVKGLKEHTEKMQLDPEWWTVDDINIDECPVGGCLRDHALLSVFGVDQERAAKSILDAEKIAGEKGEFSHVDPSIDQRYSGKIMGLTDSHVVQSLGRTAAIYSKSDLTRVPAIGEDVLITFKGGKGAVVTAKDLGRQGSER
jgi:hypothetical protein